MRLPFGLLLVVAFIQETIGRLTGREVLITRESVRTMHSKHKMTSEKAQRELGARFRPLEETLKDVVEWYRSHPGTASV